MLCDGYWIVYEVNLQYQDSKLVRLRGRFVGDVCRQRLFSTMLTERVVVEAWSLLSCCFKKLKSTCIVSLH